MELYRQGYRYGYTQQKIEWKTGPGAARYFYLRIPGRYEVKDLPLEIVWEQILKNGEQVIVAKASVEDLSDFKDFFVAEIPVSLPDILKLEKARLPKFARPVC